MRCSPGGESSHLSSRMPRRFKMVLALLGVVIIYLSSRPRQLTSMQRIVSGHTPMVCSMLKRLIPRSAAHSLIVDLMKTSPPGALMVDVGLAHGDECIAVADVGRRCMGFEADPLYAKQLRMRASQHANASLVSITSAAAGDRQGFVSFSADRHNRHGVGGTLSSRLNESSGDPLTGWEQLQIPIVRLDNVVPRNLPVFLLKSDTQVPI